MKELIALFLLLVSSDLIGQKSYFIESSDSTKLNVQEFGVGEPVIFLAGGPGYNAVYMKQVWDSLSVKYRCIILDQRGTGKSFLHSRDSVSLKLSNYIKDLEALRTFLRLDQLTLIGHSWGGMLSLEYAARYPEHLKRMILLGPGGPTNRFIAFVDDNIRMILRDEDLKEIDELDKANKTPDKELWPAYFYDRNRALASKSTIDFDELSSLPEIYRFIFPSYFSTQKERVKLLVNYKGIVHIIQGRQDLIVGESTINEIKELLPKTQVHFIERCGHMPWLENQQQVKNFYALLFESLK